MFLTCVPKLILPAFSFSRQQNSVLRRTVDRIRNSLELKVVLQTAVDELADLFQLDACLFFWYFEDSQRIQVICEQGQTAEPSYGGYSALADLGETGQAIRRGEMVVKGTLPLPQFLNSLLRLTQPNRSVQTQFFGTETYLLLPVAGEQRIGYLACLSHQARSWSTANLDLARSIAQQLEIAIQQAYLYEKTQKQAQREKLVNQITSQTRQSFDLEIILTQAIDQLMTGIQADRCLVHLVEEIGDADGARLQPTERVRTPHGEALYRRHLYEICRPPLKPSIADFDPNGPITQWVIQHRKPVIISDVTQDDRIGPNHPEYQKAEIKSSLVVPVQANGTLHAILYLNQCFETRYWSKNDQKLVRAVADQLAISIQQAHLYAKTQRQAADSAAQAQYLAKTLRELQLTQSQLIQSEKMSSLGRMVAGVAHEINNPVGFIYGNLPYIERYCRDLLRLVEAYQAHCPKPSPTIQALEEEMELDFLVQDLFLILNSMNLGAARIRDVVTSLRNFSRLDESCRKTVDIHEGLESTFSILHLYLNDGVQLLREYGDLPPVECYPKLLNQVFMNILMNAIEALKRSVVEHKVVIIRTERLSRDLSGEDWIRITIADNGPGIHPDVQPKIFDPFFTTKEIGQGSGLGLAISYQTVVNQHRGQLRVYSEPNQGTEFVIEIPVRTSKILTPSERGEVVGARV
ncbi:MAG: GAF domain-containing protein [Leptolyngbyaceae cyanobacterium bins.59]|nr:GAF domain-containing protein [Leptolyngbyaceae cyanobacterium bins.59]